MSKTSIILVHEACHRPWHVHFLKAELETDGYLVSSPALPSMDGEPATMSAEAEVIWASIEQAASVSDKISPIFHSYAGVPGSEAVAQLSEAASAKIHRLIQIAAFILPEGKSSIKPRGTPPPWAIESEDGLWRYVPDPIPPFYHDVEPVFVRKQMNILSLRMLINLRAREVAARWVPQCKPALLEKTKFAGWRLFPRTYVVCEDDRAVSPTRLKRMFEALSEEDRQG